MFKFINYFKRKNNKNNKIDHYKIINCELSMLKETRETLELANDIIKKLNNKIYDYSLHLDKLLHMINDAIITLDENGIIMSSNNSANEIFSYSGNELIGIDFNNIVHDNLNTDIIEKIAKKCENHVYYYKKCKGIKKNKELFYIEMSISKILKSDGTYYFLIILKDITNNIKIISDLKKDNKKGV